MHSDLSLHLHDQCVDVIKALQSCHSEKNVKKFFGVCNTLDRQLATCLKQEKKVKRKRNFDSSIKSIEKCRQTKDITVDDLKKMAEKLGVN